MEVAAEVHSTFRAAGQFHVQKPNDDGAGPPARLRDRIEAG